MSRKLRKETDCLNCGAEVKDTYCPKCGQPNYEPKESFRHIMTHFLTDYLHLDEKFFSSLKFLFLKPGFLTNEYNAGRRTKYVHPFRLYIFITIVFFIVQSLDHRGVKISNKVNDKNDTTVMVEPMQVNPEGGSEVQLDNEWYTSEDSTVEQYTSRQAALPENKRDNFIEAYFNKKSIVAREKKFNISEKIMHNFNQNIPKMMFLMLPLFALILFLFFRKSKLFYVEHFYHSVFLHSFFYLYRLIFLIPTILLPDTWRGSINFVMLLGLAFYLYKSLRNVYDENAILTIVKMMIGVLLYFSMLMVLVVCNALISFMLL